MLESQANKNDNIFQPNELLFLLFSTRLSALNFLEYIPITLPTKESRIHPFLKL